MNGSLWKYSVQRGFQTFSCTLNPVFHVVFACAKLTGSVSLTKAQVVRKRKCVGALFVCLKGKGKHVNQVNQNQAATTTTASPTSSSPPPAAPTTRTTTTSQPPTNSVRRVRLAAIVTSPDANTTYVFDISDNDAVADLYDDFPEDVAVRAVRARSPHHGNPEPDADRWSSSWTPALMRE